MRHSATMSVKKAIHVVSNSRHYHRDALSADTLLNLMKSYSDCGAVTATVRGLLVVALVVSQLKPQWLPRWPLTVTKGGWPSNWCCLCVPGILISTYTEVPDLHIPSINLPVYVKKKPFQLPTPRYLSVVLPKIRQQTLCSHAGAMGLLRRPPVGRWWGHWWLLTRYPLVPPTGPLVVAVGACPSHLCFWLLCHVAFLCDIVSNSYWGCRPV